MFSFLMILLFYTHVRSAPSQITESLADRLKSQNNCSLVFPSPKLELPQVCFSTSVSKSKGDIKLTDDKSDVYLCWGLIDVKERLCAANVRNDTLETNIGRLSNENANIDVCAPMSNLNTTTTLKPAKTLYKYLQRQADCYHLCSSLDGHINNIRRAICDTLLLGHAALSQSHGLRRKSEIERGVISTSKSNLSNQSVAQPLSAPGSNVEPLQTDNGKGPGTLQSLAQNNGTKSVSDAAQNSMSQLQSKSKNATKGVEEVYKLPGVTHAGEKTETQGSVEKDVKGAEETTIVEENGEVSSRARNLPTDLEHNLMDHSGDELEMVQGDGKPHTHVPDVMSNSRTRTGMMQDLNDPPSAAQVEPGEEQSQQLDSPPGNVDAELPESKWPSSVLVPGSKSDATSSKGVPVQSNNTSVPKTSGQQNSNSKAFKENPVKIIEPKAYGSFVEAEDSHFFAYFMSLSAFFIICYLAYHNKRKIIAIAVEGKKSRSTGRRRPTSASYHKLDSNLEEAMSSSITSTNSYVIY